MSGVRVTIADKSVSASLASFCKAAKVKLLRLTVGPQLSNWQAYGWAALVPWDHQRWDTQGCPSALGGALLSGLALLASGGASPSISVGELASMLTGLCGGHMQPRDVPQVIANLAAYLFALQHHCFDSVEAGGRPADVAAGIIREAEHEGAHKHHLVLPALAAAFDSLAEGALSHAFEAATRFGATMRAYSPAPQALLATAAHLHHIVCPRLHMRGRECAACCGNRSTLERTQTPRAKHLDYGACNG